MGSMMGFQSLMEKEKKTPKAIQMETPMERLNLKVKEMGTQMETPMEKLNLKEREKGTQAVIQTVIQTDSH